MSRRVLGIELRRSAALWAGATILAFALALLYLADAGPWNRGGGAWNVQWIGLARWPRLFLMFFIPLALAVGGWQGSRDRRSKMDELLTTASRPAWRRAVPAAAAMAIGLACGYLAILVPGGIQVASRTDYFPPGWIPVAVVGALSLIAAVWLGMGIGRLLPSVLTPPVLALAGLVTIWFVREAPLSPVMEGVYDIPLTVPGEVSLAQVVWFGALAAAGFVLLACRGVGRLAAVLPVVLGVVVAPSLVPEEQAGVFALDQEAVELVCADGLPRVCVTRAHGALLSDVVGPAREALATLGTLPDPPTSVEETPMSLAPPGPARRLDVLQVDFGYAPVVAGGRGGDAIAGQRRLTPDELRLALLGGAGTLPCPEDPPPGGGWARRSAGSDSVARAVAASWLVGELRPLPGDDGDAVRGMARMIWEDLRSLPAEQQRDRVAALREAALTCEYDLTSVLQGRNLERWVRF